MCTLLTSAAAATAHRASRNSITSSSTTNNIISLCNKTTKNQIITTRILYHRLNHNLNLNLHHRCATGYSTHLHRKLATGVLRHGISRGNSVARKHFCSPSAMSVYFPMPSAAAGAAGTAASVSVSASLSTISLLLRSLRMGGDRFLKLYAKHAFVAGCAIALIKTAAADYVIQTQIERKKSLNWNRLTLFAAFGVCYTGCVHYAIYCKLYPTVFRYLTIQKKLLTPNMAIVSQMLFDTLVHTPFFYFPVFYAMKGIIVSNNNNNNNQNNAQVGDNGGNGTLQNIKQSLEMYFFHNFYSDVSAMVSVWLPCNALTFSVIPVHWRVPWLAAVSFMWTMYLSKSRGKANTENEKK